MLLDGMRSNAANSWGIKLAFGLIIVVFVFWGIGSVQAPTGVVASVDDAQITFREFQRSYSQMTQEIKRVIPDVTDEQLAAFGLESSVLQQLILSSLLEEESARTGIDVSGFELRNVITSLPYFQNEKGEFDKKRYEEVIKQSGQNIAEFEGSLRNELLPEHFKQILSAGVFINDTIAQDQYDFGMEKRSVEYVTFPYNAANQVVTDKEIEDAYNIRQQMYALPARIQLEYLTFNPDNMADPTTVTDIELKDAYAAREMQFAVPEEVKARHILIQTNQGATESDVALALTKITDIEKRIRAGEKFEDLAKEFGQDGTKETGGDLGWFAKNQMVPAFAEAAFSLGIGELSNPVRTNFGYHLILVEAKKEARTRGFDEVQVELRDMLALEKVNASLQDIVDASLLELTNNKSFAEVATTYHLAAEQTELLDADALANSLGLRPSDVKILMSVEKGTLWDTPISLDGGLALVRVVDSHGAMVQPLAEVKDFIKEDIAKEKAQKAAFEDAKKAVVTFPNVVPQKIETSSFFLRNGVIGKLGTNILLAKDIFANDDKNWKETPFTFESGVIVVRLAEIEKANKADFDVVKQALIDEMKLAKTNIMFQRYVAMLHAKADIKILMPELFNQSAEQ